eukprot:9499776-Pyramimonas_sp.AAC.1
MVADPWTHERLSAQSQKPLPRLARELRASEHRWCRVGAKYYCANCSSFSNQGSIFQACETLCGSRGRQEFKPIRGRCVIGGKELHPSHTLQYW